MSLVLKTVAAFPQGRTTEEVLVLVGASFVHDRRMAVIAELGELAREGRVLHGRDGRWRVVPPRGATIRAAARGVGPGSGSNSIEPQRLLCASPANFGLLAANDDTPSAEKDAQIAPEALVRYWRSALRADPRGAIRQVEDTHGIEWSLISGRGPLVPGVGETLRVTVDLDAIAPTFREALLRREGHENALAIGWPIHVARDGGMPVFYPVGLIAATWGRTETALVLDVDADALLVNPEWVRAAAPGSGWKRDTLGALFDATDGVDLRAQDFLGLLREAVASQSRGRLTGADLASKLDPDQRGIVDAAALFLPTESTFTAGAARDLDRIAAWPREAMARTALAPILGLSDARVGPIPAVEVAGLNAEQVRAVFHACTSRLSVVTGPPGTGKSQAIVSMAASALLAGECVLVASKNHQALDAVEDRLGSLAEDVPFLTRTLNPATETDTDFVGALKDLVEAEARRPPAPIDPQKRGRLESLAVERGHALATIARKNDLECELAELTERLAARKVAGVRPAPPVADISRTMPLHRRFLAWLSRLRAGPSLRPTPSLDLGPGAAQRDVEARVAVLRSESAAMSRPGDPLALGPQIATLAAELVPVAMREKCFISDTRRREIAELHDDWTFAGARQPMPQDLGNAVLAHRPLWLASVLGTPKRIPLEPALFDLVIFDEASQCDIATAIPLLARARRAVIVGDDQQLSFIPQLGRQQDRNLMQAQGLPLAGMGRYAQSRRSLFDLAIRLPDVPRVTLRHQYRSAAPIVDYISSEFYGGQLLVASNPDTFVVPQGQTPGLAWHHVPATAFTQEGNVHPAEVAAIVDHLRRLRDQGYAGSIGVISPFRAQVNALGEAIGAAIPRAWRETVDLKVGTVDGFQGQERDLIAFSPCVGPRSPHSGLAFFQRDARRLNVAFSRARAVAMIFGDLDFARGGAATALRKLAAAATEPRRRTAEGVFDSDWERRVYHALKARGLDPQPQYEIAGRRLDFALFGSRDIKLDLEVDGRTWHEGMDGRRKTSDLSRDQQLRAMGWTVRRFWVDELARDMEGCLDVVERDLRQV